MRWAERTLQRQKRRRQQECVLLQNARRAEERSVLREEEDEDVNGDDGNCRGSAQPANQEKSWTRMVNRPAYGPAGEQPSRINKQNEEHCNCPAQLRRNHGLDF